MSLFVIIQTGHSAFEINQPGARPLALSGSVVALAESDWALYFNPAAIPETDHWQIQAFYRTFYELPGISQINVMLNKSLSALPISLGVQRYGNQLYSESTLSAASRYALDEDIKIGLTLNVYNLSIENYGSASAFGMNIGFQYRFAEQFSLGAQITNINRPQIGEAAEDLPQQFVLGVDWQPVRALHVLTAYSRDIAFEDRVTAAIAYQTGFGVEMRLGISDIEDTLSIGVGYASGWFKTDYALLVHQELGTSHAVSLQVDL